MGRESRISPGPPVTIGGLPEKFPKASEPGSACRAEVAPGRSRVDDAEVAPDPLRFAHETLPQRVHFAAGEAADAVAEEVRRLEGSRVMAIASRPGPGRSRCWPAYPWPCSTPTSSGTCRSRSPSGARAIARASTTSTSCVSVGGGSTTGTGQGGRPHHRAADRRGADDVRRLGGHRRLGPDRGRPQDHRRRPAGAAPRRRLRREPDARPARRARASRRDSTRSRTASTRCGRRAPTRSTRPLALEGDPRAERRAARGSSPTRRSSAAASRRCTAPTCRPWPSPRPDRDCTTRSATCSAGCSTCRTPRRMPSCCRTCWPSTLRPCPTSTLGWQRPSGATPPWPACNGCGRRSSAPRSLRDLGLAEADLERAVGPILEAAPPSNPVPVTAEEIAALLHAAYDGKDPG